MNRTPNDRNKKNASNIKVIKSSGGQDPRDTYICELEGGQKYRLTGIHWFRESVNGGWIKVRDDCVPKVVIKDFDKFSKEYFRG